MSRFDVYDSGWLRLAQGRSPGGTRRAGWPSELLRAALVLTTAVLVSACGTEERDRTPSGSAGGGWKAAGPSFGVDETTWPESMDGARASLNALPERLAGETRRLMPSPGDEPEDDYAAASYGEVASVIVSDDVITGDAVDASGEQADGAVPPRTVVGAQRKLGVLFGLGYGCAPDSYAGNVAAEALFGRPELEQDRTSEQVWFSCDVDGAEGDEDFSARAVGWTSSRTAWLVIARDDATARSLIASLHEAAG